uniref:Phosphotransferase n=1 Tax=Ditylenchus dipsaci TaxID=166011 RepID=A0A915E4V4_9BILA
MKTVGLKERTRTATLDSLDRLKAIHLRTTQDLAHSDDVRKACECLQLTDENLRLIMRKMNESFEAGLHPATASTAAVKMLPSYVRSVPNGKEQGDFLALDLVALIFGSYLFDWLAINQK